MVQQIYGVFDRKSALYRFPQFVRTEGQAIRSFETGCLDPQTEMGRFPADFDLYLIGSWDDERGVLIPRDQPSFVISALTVINAAMRRSKEDANAQFNG